MTYTMIAPKAVQKQLDALPNDIYERIAVKIQQLAEDPRPDVLPVRFRFPSTQPNHYS